MYSFTCCVFIFFFFSSRRRHTRCSRDWSSDVCSSDLNLRGTLAMARTNDPNSATAQFFINVKNNAPLDFGIAGAGYRSEERRVGKECRSRWSRYPEKKKKQRSRPRDIETENTDDTTTN